MQKDKCYRAVRDWDQSINFGLQHLFAEERQKVSQFVKEFDEKQLLEEIEQQIEEERRCNADFISGVSSPINLRALYILCRTLQPHIVVETGVGNGASSLILLTALELNNRGKLYSIDLPPAVVDAQHSEYGKLNRVSLPPNKSTGWLVPNSLRHRWELILGDSKKELSELLGRVKRVDLFYHDAEHTRDAMLWEYRAVWPCLGSGGVLTSDDIGWNTAFNEFTAEQQTRAVSKRWFGFGMMRKR